MTTIIVADIDEGRRALSAAGDVVLVHELGLAGIGWWREVLGLLRAEFPGRAFDAVLDCGPAPGQALAALRAGLDHIAVEADDETFAKLQAIAAGMGARVTPSPPLP